ncbi:YccT family protein [Aliivibrio kagoshimensis]|uniref:YccT family protein n=1 Tax=Aliivibrio kagoshimensis TaxID=2910230 RepID=UPI003D0FCB7D
MKYLSLFLVLLPCFSSIAMAAELTYSPNLTVYTVDNAQAEERIELEPGKHQISVKFASILDDGSQSRSYSSKPYIIEFEVTEEKSIYLSEPRVNRYRDVTRVFKASGVNWTLKSGNKNIPYTTEILPPSESGFMPYGDVPAIVAEHNKINGNTFTSGSFSNLKEQAVQIKANGEIELNAEPLSQLKMWYIEADNTERKEFKRWMIDQD